LNNATKELIISATVAINVRAVHNYGLQNKFSSTFIFTHSNIVPVLINKKGCIIPRMSKELFEYCARTVKCLFQRMHM
jgi:hypothetical protein